MENANRLADGVVKFRLAASVPGPDDGTSLMRGLGPLNIMAREDRRLEIVLPPQTAQGYHVDSWHWLHGCDALFLQRPWRPVEARAAVMAKMMGLPVWVDWDDDLLSLPAYNPRKGMYPPEQVGPMIEKFLRLADFVTVSTEEIKRRRATSPQPSPPEAEREKKITVIPNGCMFPLVEGARERRITWRGWGNHDADLLDILPMIEEEAGRPQNSQWKWTFIGERPWQVDEAIPAINLEADDGADPFLYLRILQECRPWVHIVPLRDNAFNRCRSNLAWIEATCAGAVVIAPDWDEWRRPGVLNYADNGDFRKVLRTTLESYSLGLSQGSRNRGEHHNVAASRAWIEQNLTMEKVNSARWGIVNKMVAMRK